jgi:peptidoglycan/xylan/chitin deacetylase (PgdA/CDA1 family)
VGSSRRSVTIAAAVAAAVAAFGSSSAGAARAQEGPKGPLELVKVSVKQDLRDLVLKVRTRGAIRTKSLTKYPRSPSAAGQRFLCLGLRARQTKPSLLCTGGKRRGRLGVSRLAGGQAKRTGGIAARITRPAKRRIEIRFRPGEAGLRPGPFSWHVVSGWTGRECRPSDEPDPEPDPDPANACLDRAPEGDGGFRSRVFELRPVGCTRTRANPVTNGSRSKRAVALTFDDGPSAYTARILSALDQRGVPGTFYALGSLIGSRAGLMRQAVERGHELANHSYRHSYYPGFADLRSTSAAIRRATGFTPCTFRPPGRLFNRATVDAAARNGMTTVLWDVDPRDWTTPGSGAIYSRVVGAARPGSIILLHDGGGDRGQTAAALPRIISTLRSRGYRFRTVGRLLGGRTKYKKVR